MDSEPSKRRHDQADAFVQLLAAHQRKLYLFILALVQRPDDAEEILGETSLVLWAKFGTFTPGTSFWAWASQVARYEVLKYRDKQRLRGHWQGLTDEVLEQLAEVSVQESGLLEARRAALTDCLQKVSERDRKLLELRSRPGATVAQVAEEMKRPLEGLYKVYQRIHRTLGECIDRAVAREDRR
jgi:RNA polymerase sigma-70 factor